MPQSYYKKDKISVINPKTVIFFIIVIFCVIAHFTIPSDEKMEKDIASYIKFDIKHSSAIKEPTNDDVESMFYTYNAIEMHRNIFSVVGRLHNRYQTKDKIACIGIMGVVIPLIDWNDYIVISGPVKHKFYHGGKKNPQNTPIIGDKDYETGKSPDEGN